MVKVIKYDNDVISDPPVVDGVNEAAVNGDKIRWVVNVGLSLLIRFDRRWASRMQASS